jgi:hypothetical protein
VSWSSGGGIQINNQNKRFRNETQSEITEFSNYQRVDSTFTTDVKKLLTEQVLGTSLSKFSGDVAQLPSFLATYRRTTDECQFSSGENMQRLRDCSVGTAKKCVNMILFTDEAERVIITLKQNFRNAGMILQQLHSDIAAFEHVTNSKSFLELKTSQ